jgi:hypothetical protein
MFVNVASMLEAPWFQHHNGVLKRHLMMFVPECRLSWFQHLVALLAVHTVAIYICPASLRHTQWRNWKIFIRGAK